LLERGLAEPCVGPDLWAVCKSTEISHSDPTARMCSAIGAVLNYRNAPRAACTLAWDAFKQSTESSPASIALIVQRRAAIQNCCLCPVQQNF
jgi:hypothetical protein